MQQWINSRSDCDVWWKVHFIWQPVQWLDQEEAPKHFPKPNLHQKMGHGLCLVVWCPSDPLQLPESRWNHYLWEVCSANQWDAQKTATPAVGTGQRNGTHSPPQRPTTWHIRDTAQGERIVLQSFASSTIFTGSLANWLPLLQASQQHFAGKTLPQPAGCRKCWEFIKSQSMGFWFLFFTARISKFISTWQSCVDCNSSYSD